jgi:hypothetical protein
MQGLSFREYLNLTLGLNLLVINLGDILNDQVAVEQDILSQVRPLKHLGSYLKNGYYPFFMEVTSHYYSRLEEFIKITIEIELPLFAES